MTRARTLALVVPPAAALAVLMFFVPQAGTFVLAFAVGVLVMVQARSRRWAYAHGWFARSHSCFASLLAAQARGLTLDEWLISEVERDGLFYAEHCTSRRDKRRMVANARRGAPE